jgi:hypothetical protein
MVMSTEDKYRLKYEAAKDYAMGFLGSSTGATVATLLSNFYNTSSVAVATTIGGLLGLGSTIYSIKDEHTIRGARRVGAGLLVSTFIVATYIQGTHNASPQSLAHTDLEKRPIAVVANRDGNIKENFQLTESGWVKLSTLHQESLVRLSEDQQSERAELEKSHLVDLERIDSHRKAEIPGVPKGVEAKLE